MLAINKPKKLMPSFHFPRQVATTRKCGLAGATELLGLSWLDWYPEIFYNWFGLPSLKFI